MSLAEIINKQEIIDATDQCVQCGLCLPHCPTYNVGKTEPESPRGRIALVRALYEEQLDASDITISHLDHCLTCMNCERVCPANVDYEKIIDAGRAATRKQHGLLERLQQSLVIFFLSNTVARKILKAFITAFRASGLHRLLSNGRLFSLFPESSTNVPDYKMDGAKNGPNIAIINSCAGDLVSDQTLNSAKLIFFKLGCKVVTQKQTQCCGALHQHTGDLKTASELRQGFLDSFKNQKLDHLVSLATGCGAQIKRYAKLENSPIAHEITDKLMDVNEFVLQQLKNNNLIFAPLTKKVYLHKPCSQQQVASDATVVEQLLNFIPEIEIVTFEDELVCCGAGGMNTITQHKLAEQLIENKMLELKNTSASYLVSSNIGCALHFQAQLKSENTHVQVCHPITLLAQQLV